MFGRVARFRLCANCGHRHESSRFQPKQTEFSRENAALMRSYKILQVSAANSDVEIRQAFIDLAKSHHPDSSDKPDNEKFKSVEEAYRIVMKSRKTATSSAEEMEESIERDIRHTAPQHRQFLSNEGIGYGTISQRQKQYQQFRLDRANESAFQYRLEKLTAYTEDALVSLDKQATRRSKTQNAIERVVEDLIQESMSKGEFSNLRGMGKPLDQSDTNPYVDSMTNKINKILINNGFVPEWAQLGKEIETLKISLKERMIDQRSRFDEDILDEQKLEWERFLESQAEHITEINGKIHKFNFVVPTIQQQLAPLRIEILAKKVCDGNEWREIKASQKLKEQVKMKAADERRRDEDLFLKLSLFLKSIFVDKSFLRFFK